MIARIQEPIPATRSGTDTPTAIETLRLSLTGFKPSDLDALVAIFADRDTARMTHAVPHPFSEGDAVSRLARMMQAPDAHWAIRTGDETLIGTISLTRGACGQAADLHTFGPNLSVFIAPDHQRQGYATEAIDGLLRRIKKRKTHKVIHAAHFADNLASARLLVHADFLYTGRRTLETSLAREGEHQALHMIRLL
ncbi:MAG: GNAT family N-acetyltransferase [Asticcacaulis sp.]|uniref:GNAT family N-acetyltransferase n=1 Tax=Asticcacaulis sp. TaxID=1872648 RepID=UPI003F7C9722